MKNLIFLVLLFVGCSQPVVQTKKYMVVSMFNDVVLETNEKAEAYEYAYNLTSMGRVFASKPVYFVLEK
jgi:hypothetical protein